MHQHHNHHCHRRHIITDRYTHPGPQYNMKAMLDLELVLLEELGFNLVLFSPYDSLAQLANDAGHPTLLAAAWGVLNDAHCTPLVLCQPPHILTVAALVTVRVDVISYHDAGVLALHSLISCCRCTCPAYGAHRR